MAGEFGDLLDLDFGSAIPTATEGASSFLPNLKDFSLGVSSYAPEGLKLASEAMSPSASAPSSGGFWSKFFSTGGDILKGAGDVAKSVLPFASLGTGILGALNQRDIMSQIAKQAPITQAAEKQQLANAQQGAALAPKAAEVAPQIKELAPRFGELSSLVQDRSKAFSDLATQLRETGAAKFSGLADELKTGVARPEVDYGRKLLAMADAGTLMDADKAKLDDWERRAIADAEGYLARSGQGDSSARESMLQDIRAKRAAAESDIIGEYRAQALSYLQAGGGQLSQGVAGLTAQEIATLVQSGALNQEEINALIQAGALTAEQAAVLGASVAPLSAAGGILAGSAGAASAAAASSMAQEKTLEELIANLQAQLGLSSGRA